MIIREPDLSTYKTKFNSSRSTIPIKYHIMRWKEIARFLAVHFYK
jgi:hypothetical protein